MIVKSPAAPGETPRPGQGLSRLERGRGVRLCPGDMLLQMSAVWASGEALQGGSYDLRQVRE